MICIYCGRTGCKETGDGICKECRKALNRKIKEIRKRVRRKATGYPE